MMRRGGGGGGGGRRGKYPRGSGSFQERPSPFNTPLNLHRNSDASLCSSRPSSAGSRPSHSNALLTDRHSQSAALRSINAYLSSLPLKNPLFLKPPLPSARDITGALGVLLDRLDWPEPDLESDLPFLLKSLGCPLKLTKSALKAPGTPHAWPPLLSAINWLVQFASYSDHCKSSTLQTPPPNDLLCYVFQSYSHFLSNNDEAIARLDQDYAQKTQHHASSTAASLAALEHHAQDLEHQLRRLTTGPSSRQALEGERGLLLEDVKKFEKVVETWGAKVAAMEARLGEQEKELERKEAEVRRIQCENGDMKQRVDAQLVSARDVERMRRELQALERDIAEAECGRNEAEEKAWEIEASVGRKFKEIEALAAQCNQAIRKLKLGKDIQYVPNAKGSSPAEVMGINYKTTLKPALSTLAEDTNKTSVSKLDELMTLQNKSLENAAMLEGKRKCIEALQTRCEKAEARLKLLKKEIEDHATRCASEAGKTREEFTRKEKELAILEKEAEDFLGVSGQKLQDAVRESDSEVQMCASELLKVIDAASEYKEFMESAIAGRKKDLSETAQAVAEAHKASVYAKLMSQ